MIRRCALATGVAALIALAAPPAHAANLVSASVPTFSGSPSHTGRIQRDFIASTCAAPKMFVNLTATGSTFLYRNHTFRSALMGPECVSIDVNTACTSVFTSAYLGTFDPADPRIRWAADPGDFGAPVYSLTIPGGQFFSIVVSEIAACASGYTLSVDSVGPWTSTPPTISGTAAIGSVITGNDAPWRETPSVARQWVRCDSAGDSCVDIAGATGVSYTVTDADLGHTLRFRNHATDAGGTNSSQSLLIEPYIPLAAHPTESLGAGDRAHSGVFVRDSVESRCSAPTSVPTILQPATLFFYDTYPVQSLLNDPVCFVVYTLPACSGGVTPEVYNPAFDAAQGLTAGYAGNSGRDPNLAGTASVVLPAGEAREAVVSRGHVGGTCASYGVTLGTDAPFAAARPSLSGNAVAGGTLTASDGSWSGTPAISHAWLRCGGDGGLCVLIPGATAASYTPTGDDVGSRLRARVTATQGRSVSSDSEPSEPVAAAPDITGPVVRLRLGSRNLRRALRTGRVPVKVTCNEACAGRVQLRVSKRLAKRLKLRSRVIARANATVPAGRETTVRAKLTRRARRALRALSLVRFRIVTTLADAAGNRSPVSVRASLKRPRRR